MHSISLVHTDTYTNIYSTCTASHTYTWTYTYIQTYVLYAQNVHMDTHTHSCQQFLSFKKYPCSISQVIMFWGVFWYAYRDTSLDKIRGVYVTSRSHIHLIHFLDLWFICHEFICFPSRNQLHSSLFSLEHQFVKELHTVMRGNLISEGSKEGRLTFQFQRP